MTESTVINMSPYLFLLNLFCSNTILADLTEWSFYGKPPMVTLCTDMNIHEEMIAYLSIGIWLYFVTKIDLIIDDSFRVSLFINFGCLQDLGEPFGTFMTSGPILRGSDKWKFRRRLGQGLRQAFLHGFGLGSWRPIFVKVWIRHW